MCSDLDRSDNIRRSREKKYALVEFPRKKAEQQPIVDLILSSWINESTQTCFYPKKKDYPKLNNWIEEGKNPDESWLKNEKIKVIKKYRSPEKAKRGLNEYILRLETGDTTDTLYSENPEESEASRNAILAFRQKNPTPGAGEQGITENSTKRTPDSTLSAKRVKKLKNMISLMEQTIMKDIEKTFHSITYDVDEKLSECERKLILNFRCPLGKGISDEKETLHVSLPISDVNTFQEFNNSLKSDAKKLAALKAVMTRFMPKTSVKDAIVTILPKIMGKSVQLQYSLTGKSNKGVEKFKFNETSVYACLKDVLCNRFGIEKTCKEIGKRISRWLIGAPDRDGGRKLREGAASHE